MMSFRVVLFALASVVLSAAAAARPVLVAPIPLVVPAPPEVSLRYEQPAIDGDTVLAPTRRHLSGDQYAFAIHIFERASNGAWNYAGVLWEGSGWPIIDGALAVVNTESGARVFERGAQGWAQTATIVTDRPREDYALRI